MFPYELILTACLLNEPGSCVERAYPFEAINGLPTECAAFGAVVVTDWRITHPQYRVKYRCQPSRTEASL